MNMSKIGGKSNGGLLRNLTPFDGRKSKYVTKSMHIYIYIYIYKTKYMCIYIYIYTYIMIYEYVKN